MPLATNNEALAEFGRNAGSAFPDRQWLLTDWDVWVQNPHYHGPPQRHPEEDPPGMGTDPPWMACGDCGADMSRTHGWCLDFGCCGLGGATMNGRIMAHQEKLARYAATFPGEPHGQPTSVPLSDPWDDMPF